MRILVVEDTRFFCLAVQHSLSQRLAADVTVTMSLAETRKALAEANAPFDLALVDLVLPDGKDGEALEALQAHGIPCVVFTGLFSEAVRERLLARDIIDYVVKGTPASLDTLCDLVGQLARNHEVPVLVVDDSPSFRAFLRHLLSNYLFQVVEAASGAEALKLIDGDTPVRLMIVDYHMPDMNGIELISKVRARRSSQQLAIIGMSSDDKGTMSATYIKHGANDFMPKRFQREEFFWRVVQNVKMLDLMDRLANAASTDALTGLANRKSFFDSAERLFASWQRGQVNLAVAMLDLDHFKQVNDRYGHAAGDAVLKAVATCLAGNVRKSDVVARLGGEEFAVILVNMDAAHLARYFETLRKSISELIIESGGMRIPVTASIGVTALPAASFAAALNEADRLLYVAKTTGRNRVELQQASALSAGLSSSDQTQAPFKPAGPALLLPQPAR